MPHVDISMSFYFGYGSDTHVLIQFKDESVINVSKFPKHSIMVVLLLCYAYSCLVYKDEYCLKI